MTVFTCWEVWLNVGTTMAQAIFKTNSSFHAHSGKSLIPVFQEFSASIDKAFTLAGGMGTGVLFYGV